MSNPFEARLQAAFAPLLDRARRRVARLKDLRAQPATEATAKSIAAEQREIQLVKDAAEAMSALVSDAAANAQAWASRAEGATAAAVVAYDDATHYEAVFHRTVALLTPVPAPALSERTRALEARVRRCLAIQKNPRLLLHP